MYQLIEFQNFIGTKIDKFYSRKYNDEEIKNLLKINFKLTKVKNQVNPNSIFAMNIRSTCKDFIKKNYLTTESEKILRYLEEGKDSR